MKKGVKKAIYRLLSERPEWHPTAKDIYKEISVNIIGIAFSSVYRALENLVKEGKITSFKLECEDERRFDAVTEEHVHFKCTECGRVYNIDLDLHNAFKDIAVLSTGHIITGVKVTYFGVCKECFGKRLKKLIKEYHD